MQEKTQVLHDLYQNYGNDLQLAPGNDLQTVTTLERSKQRVLRRLMTNPGDYIWHPTYGAGLPSFIGQTMASGIEKQIESLIVSQIFLEASVAQNPFPVILIQALQSGFFVQINYTESSTNLPVVLNFDVFSTAGS